jgi:hypothetical protein
MTACVVWSATGAVLCCALTRAARRAACRARASARGSCARPRAPRPPLLPVASTAYKHSRARAFMPACPGAGGARRRRTSARLWLVVSVRLVSRRVAASSSFAFAVSSACSLRSAAHRPQCEPDGLRVESGQVPPWSVGVLRAPTPRTDLTRATRASAHAHKQACMRVRPRANARGRTRARA